MSAGSPGGRPQKRSLTLHGHRTSVSLEGAFWDALRAAARADGLSVNALAERIDDGRGDGVGLASAIRVWLLARAGAGAPLPDGLPDAAGGPIPCPDPRGRPPCA